MPKIKKGLDFLILAQVLTAISIVSAKYLLITMPLFLLIITRFLLAGIMLYGIHHVSRAGKTPLKQYVQTLNSKDYLFLTLQAFCAGILFNFFMYLGLEYTDANLAGIIASALPAIITIMAWLILKESISRKKMMCVLYATLGLIVVSIDKLKGETLHANMLGNFFVFLALFPEAFYYILCKLHPSRLPPFLASSIINLFNGFLCLVSLIFIHIPEFHVSIQDWLIVILTALASGLFYAFWFLGSRIVDGVLSSLTTAVMPIATVILAWIFLHESLTPVAGIGMGLVIFSIVTYARR